MHKRKLESMHRDKRNKTLKAERENKRGQETAGPKLLGSGREAHGGSRDQDRRATSQKERPAEA